MTAAKESKANVADRYIGQIVRTFILGREIYFFVINPEDSISKFHNAGVFYEQEELNIISRHFRGGVFVDIGAHVGNHALYLSKFLEASKIIVFEPNPPAIEVLRIHVALNRCANIDMRFLGIALAASEGQLTADSPDPNNLGGTMLRTARHGTILALPGDDLLLSEPVAFIKIDAEGMELKILAGLGKTLARWRPVMFIEVWARHDAAFRAWCEANAYGIEEQYQRYQDIQNYLVLPQASEAVEEVKRAAKGDVPAEEEFLRATLAAFDARPAAELLYELARFYRERGMNATSVLFSEPGLALARPDDEVFYGLQEEYSIAANYSRDPVRRDRGFAACNWLALSREAPAGKRELAWWNLFHYVEPAVKLLPSFMAQKVGFETPAGYRPGNPSVVRQGDDIWLVQRAVNYTVTEDGLKYETPGNAPIQTRNFLLRLDAGLETQSTMEILAPADWPKPLYGQVLGFEDMRPFVWKGAVWCTSCVRELTPEGWCEQVLARIEDDVKADLRLADWRVLTPQGERRQEKNWMPFVVDGTKLLFVYLCDPTVVVDENARKIAERLPAISAAAFRGGSQVIDFAGGWLALVHEVQWRSELRRRFYLHRFVWFDGSGVLHAVSRSFYLWAKGIEFSAGLAWHPDGQRLLISFSVMDGEAWLATVAASEVEAALAKCK